MSDDIANVVPPAREESALPAAPRKATVIHPKVAMSVMGGAVLNLLMGIAKAQGLDLSGYESDLTILVMGLIGYYVPSA